ncbi:hypothetical protein B4U78_011445 [Microbacterium esteraromaticum]|nr:hypothetical protein B4U78_011445 [Microbacterium esteraromaticum]
MIDWLLLIVTAAMASAVVLVPGLALGYGLRLRGVMLWGFAPAAGVALLAVSATLLPFAGLSWSPLTALGSTAVLVGLAAVTSRLILPSAGRERNPGAGPLWTAVAFGALLGMARMSAIIGHPENVSQTNDATFHLNVLRFIGETGSASSFDVLGALEASGFYPAAWHAIASLLTSVGFDSVLVANAVSLAIAGPVWTLSITAFVWCATGGRRLPSVSAAVLAPALYAFPFYMLDFGVLYPYALAVAIVPGILAVLVMRMRSAQRATDDAGWRGWVLATLITLVGLTAVGFAQPAALLVWLIGATSLAVWHILRRRAHPSRIPPWRTAAALTTVLLGALGIWFAVTAISSEQLWPPHRSAPRAALDLLLNSSAGPGPTISISVFAVIGFVVAVRAPSLRWLAIFGAAIAVMTLVAVSVQNPAIRGLLAAWYADWHRFLALMPLVVIPFAALGVDAVVRRVRERRARLARTAAVAALAIVLAEVGIWVAVDLRTGTHRYDAAAVDYLSTDERDLLEALPELVGSADRVVGNPSAGAAFGYALSGRDVIPRTWSKPNDPDFEMLRFELVDLAEDPAVCDAVRRMDVDYVLDFGESAQGPGKWDMPGMTGFAEAEGFEKVAEDGAASLWRITGCE